MIKKIANYLSVNMVGYRKMTLAVTFLIVCVTLLVKDYIPGEGFVKDVGFVMIAFFGANLAEHHVKKTIEIAKKIDADKIKELAQTFKDKL